jgi:hypothetical protein
MRGLLTIILGLSIAVLLAGGRASSTEKAAKEGEDALGATL